MGWGGTRSSTASEKQRNPVAIYWKLFWNVSNYTTFSKAVAHLLHLKGLVQDGFHTFTYYLRLDRFCSPTKWTPRASATHETALIDLHFDVTLLFASIRRKNKKKNMCFRRFTPFLYPAGTRKGQSLNSHVFRDVCNWHFHPSKQNSCTGVLGETPVGITTLVWFDYLTVCFDNKRRQSVFRNSKRKPKKAKASLLPPPPLCPF